MAVWEPLYNRKIEIYISSLIHSSASRQDLKINRFLSEYFSSRDKTTGREGEENFVGDSEIIALGGASNETKDRPLG